MRKEKSKHEGLGLKAHTPELFIPKAHDSGFFSSYFRYKFMKTKVNLVSSMT
jgi:hypothetical protein